MPRGSGLVSWGGGLLRTVVREFGDIPLEWEAEDSIYIEGAEQLELLLRAGSAGCWVRLEFSYDDVSWYQYSTHTTSGSDEIHAPGDIKLEDEMRIAVDVPVRAKYCRVSNKHI